MCKTTDDMTAEENLTFYAGVYGVTGRQRVDEVLEQMGLVDVRKDLVSNLSTGWKQRLALGVAFIHRPRLLFLDEPTSGVDPVARRAFWNLIYAVVAQGVTALVTTHYMDEAEFCHRVGIMRSGKLLALNSPQALKEKYIQQGAVWEIQARPLLPVLSALENAPEIQLARLSGDRISAITRKDFNPEQIQRLVQNLGAAEVKVEPAQPTLEDVFLTLSTDETSPHS
jgi:ABC-2 type transport system ATP-binding protein